MKKTALLILSFMALQATAQQVLTPEILWKLNQVSVLGITKDGKSIIYKVKTPTVEELSLIHI